MNSDDAYAIWAPVESPWSPWVKPILFAGEPDWDGSRDPELVEIAEPSWLASPRSASGYREDGKPSASADATTAFVIDLPGPGAVGWGVTLARAGCRPVPLYNALPGGFAYVPVIAPPPGEPAQMGGFSSELVIAPRDMSALIDVGAIVQAMRKATETISTVSLAPTAPPVFLLDADRRFGRGVPSPGRFDNRSISLPTDFPSAVFLRSRGIERVMLVQQASTEPQEDLAHTLLGWQQGGITIAAKSLATDAPPASIQVTRPTWYRAIVQRFLATLGLRRNPLGGFGGTIPVPSAG